MKMTEVTVKLLAREAARFELPPRLYKDGPGKGNVSITTLRKSNTQCRCFLLTNIHNMNLEERKVSK